MLKTINPTRILKKSTGVVAGSGRKCDAARKFKQDENGGIIILTLLLLMSMLVIGGMAVDFMRFEAERTRLQSVNDRAILAAANLNEDRDPAGVITDFFKAEGYENAIVGVPDIQKNANGSTITVNSQIDMDTFFLRFVGMETLSAPATATAMQGTGNVEISLILDISGSMTDNWMWGPLFVYDDAGNPARNEAGDIVTYDGWGLRLTFLKQAAKQFVVDVLLPEHEDRISINLISYSSHVRLRDDLYFALRTTPDVIRQDGQMTGSFGIQDNYAVPFEYVWVNEEGDIVDKDAPNARLITPREAEAAVDANMNAWAGGQRWVRNEMRCVTFLDSEYDTLTFNTDRVYTQVEDVDFWGWNEDRNPIPPCSYDPGHGIVLLSQNIQELHAAIDSLDGQANTSIHRGMKWGVSLLDPSMRTLIDGIPTVDDAFRGIRPTDYSDPTTTKFVVIMTDGVNVAPHRLKRTEYGDDIDYYSSFADREGFLDHSARWYGWWERNPRAGHSIMTQRIAENSDLDKKLGQLCDLIALQVEDVFTISMGISNQTMTDCASEPGNAFETTITNEPGKPGLSDIFDTIADQITALRLSL